MTAKHYEVILYQDDGWTAQKILKVLNDWPIVETYAFILLQADRQADWFPENLFSRFAPHIYRFGAQKR